MIVFLTLDRVLLRTTWFQFITPLTAWSAHPWKSRAWWLWKVFESRLTPTLPQHQLLTCDLDLTKPQIVWERGRRMHAREARSRECMQGRMSVMVRGLGWYDQCQRSMFYQNSISQNWQFLTIVNRSIRQWLVAHLNLIAHSKGQMYLHIAIRSYKIAKYKISF